MTRAVRSSIETGEAKCRERRSYRTRRNSAGGRRALSAACDEKRLARGAGSPR
ncbi:hypothetical protein C7S17_0143 [Burkholderia thailandensis]|nr:hypothetical protein [Burkholderia thailandensis]